MGGVLKGLDRFQGRSSLKTWIMRIVANIAMSRGEREARSEGNQRVLLHRARSRVQTALERHLDG